MNFLSIDDLSNINITNIFELATNAAKCPPTRLNHKIIATAFFEPSTRTKLSFHSAILRMGGTYIDLPANSSLKKGESEEDTVRTLSQYADALIIRHPEDVKKLAKYSKVPVINAGDGSNEHPTQALLDMFTIIENINWPNLKIMFTGDLYHSRTVNSLVKALDKYITHANCAPGNVEFIFTNDINSELQKYPHTRISERDIPYLIDSVDVLYMTRPQIERHNPLDKATHSDFVLTNEIANEMKTDAIIMHPLPRNKELLPEVDSNHRAKYFDQVKNGLYIRMALLYWLL